MIAYFDTAVFDQLYRKVGCGSADIAALRKAVYGRELSVRLSPHHLEEILLARKASPQALSAQLRQTLSFAGLRSLLKPCEHLLIGDVRDYASRGESGNPFLHGPIQDDYSSGIAELIESDGEEFSDEFRDALEGVRRAKLRTRALFERLQHDVETGTDTLGLAAAIAETAGVLEACEARGLEGLLQIKTVGAVVAILMANREDPSLGSGGPLSDGWHHAIGAAAVGGVFVCGDEPLRATLASLAKARRWVEGCEVTDLAGLLGRVAPR
jgi:hypothetical protein